MGNREFNSDELRIKLKELFGYNDFRGAQESVIQSLLHGHDTFVIMPTGAGKSMCYQLPAVLLEGTAIVISPLIALMKNQVDQMNACGVNARFLNSTQNKTENKLVKKDILEGKVDLLYVAPESLTKNDNITFFKSANIAFIAIDEVHCISEWGHDFRPEYRKIRTVVKEIGEFPIIALTATATPKVQLDIQKNLHMEGANLFKTSFYRDNLFYEVLPKQKTKQNLVKFVKNQKGTSGIVYCLSRKKVNEIAEVLVLNGINAAPYHAGLEQPVRVKNQDDFLNENVDVIVATVAFGMGIDKPDVRFVVHYDVPKSLEGYYQETGRGGRDGLKAKCLMFYSFNDILKLEKFNKDKASAERDNARLMLDEMIGFAETSACRTRQLLHYFGESLKEDCGHCDNCVNPKDKFEAKNDVLLALKVVKEAGERSGIKYYAEIIKGSKNQALKEKNHDKLSSYGKGAEKPIQHWTSVLRQSLLAELLQKNIENYGVLELTDFGKKFIDNPQSITFSRDHEYPSDSDEEKTDDHHHTGESYDVVLLDSLKKLRKNEADKKRVPPYVVFSDPSLQEMATTFPMTIEDMTHVNGVGLSKANKFAKPFIELISNYVEENNIDVTVDVVLKSTVNKSKKKIHIILQIDDQVDLEEIAENEGISFDKLLEEIEHINHSGTKLNLDYYIESFLDEYKQDDIYEYFMEAESDDLSDALEDLGEDYTEEEIRLMRIKFMSEIAN